MSNIKNEQLWQSGKDKIDWVRSYMPLLTTIEKEFSETKPFAGLKISMSIHLEAKTANLAKVLRAGGADVRVTGCNPLSTQDDVAAALVHEGFEVNAVHGTDEEGYTRDLINTISWSPDLLIDDGGDLMSLLHGEYRKYGKNLIGGCEETTTGVHRLIAREAAGLLDYTMIDVNDADCKHLFDNRYGTGQSVWDSIMRNTNLIVASKTVVVVGYGWCSRGIAMRAAALGAKVIVTEIDPVKAMEAKMDGYDVMKMEQAAPLGDIFVTATGCKHTITVDHMMTMKDRAILANAGHFNVEIDMAGLEEAAVSSGEMRANITGYELPNGKIINVIGEGKLANIAAADGHPAENLDLSFAVQAMSALYIKENHAKLKNGVIDVSDEIDDVIARRRLAAWDIESDELTEDQKNYLDRMAENPSRFILVDAELPPETILDFVEKSIRERINRQ